MIKELTPNDLKTIYSNIDSVLLSERRMPQQVFKDVLFTLVFDLEDFMKHGLEDIIGLSKLDQAKKLIWLPNIGVPANIQMVELNLNEKVTGFSRYLKELWEEGTLFFLLDYGCLFNDQKKWIIHFSIELEIVVLGVFEENKNVNSIIKATPYTKERFLEEYGNFPEDYLNLSYKAAEKEARIMNEAVVYPMIKNYFD
ncbi:hypothetical protein ACYRFS_05855 [Listeria kieliensis]|uniref:Uncharacterized protein n=1 Tax=Listeria kieliensis TaxID=1621700 RepID=A0A3D8TQQ8_9LIST|nr:hypothetical protein [Listeria kieliensis]RDX00719.1 hypothetical protein UR08_06975 [Listeria kieliensis]